MLLPLLAAGCFSSKAPYDSGAPEPPLPSEASIFPHTNVWADPAEHGKFVVANGTALCAGTCHGAGLEGGSGRACNTCHAVYPHQPADTWAGILGHGKYVRDKGDTKECATSCHGADLAGGLDPNGKKSCAKCHASYPVSHSDSAWASGNHGTFVVNSGGPKECSTMCHRLDAPAELKAKGCAECHASYPAQHDDQWGAGSHAKYIASFGGGLASADCSICHGAKLDGGKVGVKCATSTCHHKGGAGKAEWKTSGEHGAVAKESLDKCDACHGADLKGNALVVGCDSCHHKNWGDTHDKPWVDKSQHGSFGKASTTSCKVCHGADLGGGISKVGCKSCHEGGIYPHVEGWALGTGHGASAKADLAKCTSCHGAVTSADCRSCHHNNSAGWATGSHAVPAGSDLTKCKTCHGADLRGGASGKTCFDCHDGGNTYPHPDGWKNQFVHGVKYIANHSNCESACHGKDLKGGISGISCNSCHTTYPHADGWDDSHGASVLKPRTDAPPPNEELSLTAFSGSGVSSCSACHGPTYSHKKWEYPPSNMTTEQLNDLYYVAPSGIARCYKCHFAYPHIEGKILPTDAAFTPWLKIHKKGISVSWGSGSDEAKVKEFCAIGDGCHVKGDRKGPIRSVSSSGRNYCNIYCHR